MSRRVDGSRWTMRSVGRWNVMGDGTPSSSAALSPYCTNVSLHYRYPVILDAAIQSLGLGFVGTEHSTFSILSKRRVQDWHGGASRMVKWGFKDADAHRKRMFLEIKD